MIQKNRFKRLFLMPILLVLLLSSLMQVSALTSGEGTIIFGAIFSILVVAVFFLFISIISNNTPIKVFFISLAGLTIIFGIGFGVSVLQQYFSDFTTLIQTYSSFYQLLLILSGAGALGLIIWLVIVSFKSFYRNRGMLGDDGD